MSELDNFLDDMDGTSPSREIFSDRAKIRKALQEWIKHPERHLGGRNQQDLDKFNRNLVKALAFYSEGRHHEIHKQAKPTRTLR